MGCKFFVSAGCVERMNDKNYPGSLKQQFLPVLIKSPGSGDAEAEVPRKAGTAIHRSSSLQSCAGLMNQVYSSSEAFEECWRFHRGHRG